MTAAWEVRVAREADLPQIVAMLADDGLGRQREDASLPLDPRYLAAFLAIADDPNQMLAVMADGGEIVASLQLSFIPGRGRKGAWRAQVEALRVTRGRRGGGLGRALFDWVIAASRARGCDTVQLTTDRRRPDAHRFYKRLGFTGSHIGYMLALAPAPIPDR